MTDRRVPAPPSSDTRFRLWRAPRLRARARLLICALCWGFTQPAYAEPTIPLDQSQHPAVSGLGRALAEDAWRPMPADESEPDTRSLALTAALFDPIVVVRDDDGAFDADWSQPGVLQDVVLRILQTVRQQAPTLDPHFLVVLTTFAVVEPAAFYLYLANDVRGIGYQHLEPEEVFRFTPGRLDGVVFMNALGGWRGGQAALGDALFLQEVGHRWGVYVRLPEAAGADPTRLLGRDCAHWSHFAATSGSAMEGNPWQMADGGRWRAPVPPSVGYVDADRYLMGLLPAEAVAPLVVIGGPDTGWRCRDGQRGGVLNPRWRAPTWRTGRPAEAEGVAEAVTLDAVVEAEGARVPDHRAARRRWSAIFVVALRRQDDAAAAVEAADALRRRWAARFAEASATAEGDALSLDTTFAGARLVNPPGSVGLGGRCLDAVDCAPGWPLCVATGSGDRVCTARCDAAGDCPAEACCVRGGLDDAVCMPSMGECPPLSPVDAGPPRDGGPEADSGEVPPMDRGASADGNLGEIADAAVGDGPVGDRPVDPPRAPRGCAISGPWGARSSGWGWGWLSTFVVCLLRSRRR